MVSRSRGQLGSSTIGCTISTLYAAACVFVLCSS